MAVSLGRLERFYLLARVCEASPADITLVEVDPLLFGCEYMTQGKQTLTQCHCQFSVVRLDALGARGPGNQQKHLEYIAGSG